MTQPKKAEPGGVLRRDFRRGVLEEFEAVAQTVHQDGQIPGYSPEEVEKYRAQLDAEAEKERARDAKVKAKAERASH